MSLQFILGGSGSGKTRALYDMLIDMSMEDPDGHFIAIVPEQFNMQAQKEIVELHPRHGVMNIDIVSMKRLAYRIFEEVAAEKLELLDESGKSMVLRKLAGGMKRKLLMFGEHLNKNGFINQLKSMLSEFSQYGVSPDVLAELAREADQPLLRRKLLDLAVIEGSFADYLEGRFTTPEEILDALCRVLPDSEMIRGSVVTLDGFRGFTPVQYRLITLFLTYCKKVIVTAAIDPMVGAYKLGAPQELFYTSRQMICRLIDLSARSGVNRDEDILLTERPAWRYRGGKADALDFLEQNIYRYGKRTYPEEPEQIEIWQSRSPADEIGQVVRQIHDCVRDRGMRYLDLAVVTGDLSVYGNEVVHQFQAEGIPFFLDDKKSVLQNPMVELIRAALEVIRNDFDYESMFRYLWTGLVGGDGEGGCAAELEVDGEAGSAAAREGDAETGSAAAHEGDMEIGSAAAREGDAETGSAAAREGDVETGSASAREGDVKAVCTAESEANAEADWTVSSEEAAAFSGRRRAEEESERKPWKLGDRSVREQIDRLENYVLGLGIRGLKRWDSQWEMLYRSGKNINLEELNRLRAEIVAPLKRLKEALSYEGGDVRAMTSGLVRYLQECHIEEKMLAYQAHFTETRELSLAKEYGQVYGLVMDLCDQMVNLLGDESMNRREYEEVLNAGFEEIQVGVIPATVDRVVVGDLTRTRMDHIKVLFFVGVNDGIVPPPPKAGSLLSDPDREFLFERHVELAPTAREEGFMQRFYLYLALTKPEERLILSFASVNSAGKSLRPSSLIGDLRKLYPRLRVRRQSDRPQPSSVREAKKRVILGLRSLEERLWDQEFLEIYRYFLVDHGHREEVLRLVDAAYDVYVKRGIGKAAARALYGPVLNGSVTRLEQYASCAYSHFLRYGLELEERQEYELAAVDIGNLFHGAIDLCFREMMERGGSFAELSEEDRKRLVKHCVDAVAMEYGNTIMQSSARNQYLTSRVERITDRTVWALAEQMKRGDFEPAGFELAFSAQDNLQALKIPLSGREALHLHGRIDRLDVCEDEGRVYVKIIDYKSGSTSFDLPALYHGLQLQLVVYMDAVMELEGRRHPEKEIIPAGIFYYHINDPLVEKKDGLSKDDIDRQILRALRMDGLVNSELQVVRHLDREVENESDVIPVVLKNGVIQEAKSSVAQGERFEALRRFVRDKLKREGLEILHGAADVNPYKQGSRTACDYCPYHAVCGFDVKTPGYGYRRFKPMKPDEIWPQIEGLDAPSEDETGASAETPAEGETGASAEATAEDETGASAEATAEDETGASAETPAEGEAGASAETLAEGETGASAETPAENETGASAEAPDDKNRKKPL